jgi:hypothetical protein
LASSNDFERTLIVAVNHHEDAAGDPNEVIDMTFVFDRGVAAVRSVPVKVDFRVADAVQNAPCRAAYGGSSNGRNG